MTAKEDDVLAIYFIVGGILTVVHSTSNNALVIKMNMGWHSEEFERRLGFSFTVRTLA